MHGTMKVKMTKMNNKYTSPDNVVKLTINNGHIIWIFKDDLPNGFKFWGCKIKKVDEE